MNFEGWGSQRWAIHLSQLLNAANPPDRYRFDIAALAKEISATLFPDDPITEVRSVDLQDCEGALLPSDSRKRWGIYVNQNGSPRRRRFTAAHELGHYLVHRKKYPDGLRCDEAAVDGRNGVEIEREANDFASTLLMPLDDFRRRIPAKAEANFDQLSESAAHYDVSLVAAVLRWLRYTDRRAMIVVSRDGYMKWAWSSDAAFKSGRYFKTSGTPVEVPQQSLVGQSIFTEEARAGVSLPKGVWFNEPTKELTLRAERYDLNYTLLQFADSIPIFREDEPDEPDTYDRFVQSGAKK
jgi:IrrE N-terminal-like domain